MDYYKTSTLFRPSIRIPVSGDQALYKALSDTIGRTAARSGESQPAVALNAFYFLAEIANTLSLGGRVLIPCFGLFTSYAYERPGHEAIAQARFYPVRGLRHQISQYVPPADAKRNNAAGDTYQRSHHPSSKPERYHPDAYDGLTAICDRLRNTTHYGVSTRLNLPDARVQ